MVYMIYFFNKLVEEEWYKVVFYVMVQEWFNNLDEIVVIINDSCFQLDFIFYLNILQANNIIFVIVVNDWGRVDFSVNISDIFQVYFMQEVVCMEVDGFEFI